MKNKKNIISESKLNKIIQDSLIEVLNEENKDWASKLGRWMGRTYQGGLNAYNNLKGSIEAGRRQKRVENLDKDPYEGMDNADMARNLDKNTYRRLRRERAWKEKLNAHKYPGQDFTWFSEKNPHLLEPIENQENTEEVGVDNQEENIPQQNQEPQENQSNQQQNTTDADFEEFKNMLNQNWFKNAPSSKKAEVLKTRLEQEGLILKGNTWHRKNGRITPRDRKFIDLYFRVLPHLRENKINKINKTMKRKVRLTESDLHRIIKESVTKILNEEGLWSKIKKNYKEKQRLKDREKMKQAGEGDGKSYM